MDRSRGDVEEVGGLLDSEAAEDAEFDNLGLALVEGGEAVEGLVDIAEEDGRRGGRLGSIAEVDAGDIAATLVRVAFFGVGGEDAAHHLRGHAEQMGAVGKVNAMLPEQAHVGFVDERGGLQSVAVALAAHVAGGQAVKLVIDERHDRVQPGGARQGKRAAKHVAELQVFHGKRSVAAKVCNQSSRTGRGVSSSDYSLRRMRVRERFALFLLR